jgi:hypothetical protein
MIGRYAIGYIFQDGLAARRFWVIGSPGGRLMNKRKRQHPAITSTAVAFVARIRDAAICEQVSGRVAGLASAFISPTRSYSFRAFARVSM